MVEGSNNFQISNSKTSLIIAISLKKTAARPLSIKQFLLHQTLWVGLVIYVFKSYNTRRWDVIQWHNEQAKFCEDR